MLEMGSSIRLGAVVVGSAFLLCGPAQAASDKEIAQMMPGTWMSTGAKKDGPIQTIIGLKAAEFFYGNGTGSVKIYFGNVCDRVWLKVDFKWIVSNGVLIETGTLFG